MPITAVLIFRYYKIIHIGCRHRGTVPIQLDYSFVLFIPSLNKRVPPDFIVDFIFSANMGWLNFSWSSSASNG